MWLYRYLFKRLCYLIPVIMGVSLVIFLIFNIVAGDPTVVLLGKHATVKQMAELKKELGLDRPLYAQYVDTVKSSLTFNFGRSWKGKQNIMQMVKRSAYASATLTVPALILSTIIAILISLLSAFFYGRFLDKFVCFVLLVMMSISSLAYILFGQWFFAYKLGWFPISGYERGFPDFIPYVILPMVIWVILSVGPDVRLYRGIILEEINQDYVRTAKAKGLTTKMVLLKHVLKNAMIPIITNVVSQLPSLLLGAILLENFFGIPGLGNMTLQAIYNSDFPVIRAITILSSVFCLIFNVVADVLYSVVDPRMRLK
jgi:peptide/nickel transport system permease protein